MNWIQLAGVLLQLLPFSVQAALCATVDSVTNTVMVTTTPVGECTSLILLDSSDWVGTSVWSLPTPGDIALVWGAGFILPVTLFLIAWAIGRVVHFFESR